MHKNSSLSSSFSLGWFSSEPWRKRDGNIGLKDRVLAEGKPRNNYEMKKNEVRLALKCPNIEPLRLDEHAFFLVKGPKCEKLRGVRRGYTKSLMGVRLGELEMVQNWDSCSLGRRFSFVLANLRACQTYQGLTLANPREFSLKTTLPIDYNKFNKQKIESMAPSSFEKHNVFHKFLVPSQ